MSLKSAVGEKYFYCCMGSGCGSYLKIGLELLEKTVWNVLQKLAETYYEEGKTNQGREVRILEAVSQMKEKKKFLEMQADYCKSNRLDLYRQWKEGRLTKEEYAAKKEELTKREAESKRELELLNQQLSETAIARNLLEDRMGRAAMIEAEGLTKRLVDELIERIDVYGDNRVEIRWKFNVKL